MLHTCCSTPYQCGIMLIRQVFYYFDLSRLCDFNGHVLCSVVHMSSSLPGM